jgi:anti-anti-sigma factor
MEDALDLKMEILADQGIALIRCGGRLRFGKETQLLKKCVGGVLAHFSICVLSLKDIHQIDARGIGTLVGCLERARSMGCLLLIGGASRIVQELLEIMKLDQVLEIYSSEFEALAACSQAA